LACVSASAKENPPLLRGDLRVAGNAAVSAEKMGLPAVPARGQPLPPGFVEDVRRNIQEAYARQGYLKARVTPRLTPGAGTGLTDVTYDIVEGSVVYIEQAGVDGLADRARRAEAQRLVLLARGDRFDSDKVRQTRKRLLRLSWVKAVDISVEAAKDPDKVYVDFDVEEKPPARLP
jgi:outer membrane protein assembly factor BamA